MSDRNHGAPVESPAPRKAAATARAKPARAKPARRAVPPDNLTVIQLARTGGNVAALPGTPLPNQDEQQRKRGRLGKMVKEAVGGGGQPLDATLRQEMEPRPGHDPA